MSAKPAKVLPVRRGASALRWSAGLACSVALVAGLLAGCSPSATYLGTTAQEFYFKAPRHWETFSASGMQNLGLPTTSQSSQLKADGDSYPVYVSLASPVKHLGPKGLAGPHPWVLGIVMSLGSQDQTSISLSGLQDEVFNVSGTSSSGTSSEPLLPAKVIVKGALRGTRVAYQLGAGGTSLAFEQEAVVNSPTDKLWLLAAGCSPSCYAAHRSLISGIVRSFTVTAQGA